MRSFAALLILVVAGLAPSAAAPAESASTPRLALLARAPLAVRGLHFKAGESVRVRAIVRGGPRAAKSVVAGRRGVFDARFVSLRLSECAFLTVQATGARGSRASYTLHPPPCGTDP